MQFNLKTLLETGGHEGLIGKLEHRYESITTVVKLLLKMERPVMVETGIMSSTLLHAQGCSSLIFAEVAKQTGGMLCSVDKNIDNIDWCMKFLWRYYPDFFEPFYKDSVSFLMDIVAYVDLLYLDSYDFYPGSEEDSRFHQLQEIKTAWSCLRSGSLILLDDVNPQRWFKERLEGKDIEGKSYYAHRWIMEKPVECLIDFPAYQRLYRVK